MISNIGLNSLWYGTSVKDLAISAAFAVVFAFLGYRISQRYRLIRGVTPWKIPSPVWAIICGLFQAFGIILELVAEVTTRPQPRPQPTPNASTTTRPPFTYSGGPTSSTDAMAPITIAPANAHPPGLAPQVDGEGRPALFGWYPDPTKRHALRYWDGRFWSDNVADDGAVAVDPA
ncbi:MAG: DUF2510 domain-containing protein [Acidimicrobiales bacterium]